VPTTLEPEVVVLDRDRIIFWEPLGFHVVKLLLIHQKAKNSHAFNGGKASFRKNDRIGSITFSLEIMGYKFILD